MNTDDAPAYEVLQALRICALSWDPKVRLLGNIRASDIARMCDEVIRAVNIIKPESN